MQSKLAEHPFMTGLSPEQIDYLADCSHPVDYSEGDLLFHAGEPAHKFFLVMKGRVAIEIPTSGPHPVTVQTVDAGGIAGWSWLVPPYEWRFDCRASQPTTAFVFDARCLRGKSDEDNTLGYELLKRFSAMMAERLSATRIQLLDMYGAKSG